MDTGTPLRSREAAKPALKLGAPLKRTTLAQSVAQRLQQLIGAQRLRPGDQLPGERQLAQQLGIGRSAVREGMRLLQALQIIDVQHGRGIFVVEGQRPPLTDLSQLDSSHRLMLLRQATEARRAIDLEVARHAALHATRDDLARIEAVLTAADTEPQRTQRRYALDLTFEIALGEATHNAYLIAAQRLVHQMFRQAWESAGVIPRDADQRHAQHLDIFGAVRAGNAASAVRRMSQHFELSILPRARRTNATSPRPKTGKRDS